MAEAEEEDGLDPPLPRHWVRRESHSRPGNFYYFNTRTKETSWARPAPRRPLPEGWSEARTPEGRVYYKDHVNKTTQWSMPTAPASASTASSASSRSPQHQTRLPPPPPPPPPPPLPPSSSASILPATSPGRLPTAEEARKRGRAEAPPWAAEPHDHDDHAPAKTIKREQERDVKARGSHEDAQKARIEGHSKERETPQIRVLHLLVKHAGSRNPSSWRTERITLPLKEAITELKKIREQIVEESKREPYVSA